MSLRLRLVICFAGSLCSLAPRASADLNPDPAPPVPDAPASAAPDAVAVASHVRRGDKARRASRWYEAIAAYVEALTTAERAGLPPEKIAPILGELGVCELALRKHADAAEHLYRSLEHEEALTGEQKTRYRQAQQRAEREVATVYLGVVPADAQVRVDGRPIGAAAAHVIFLEPGEHTVRARLEGYVDATLELKEAAGARVDYAMSLAREAPPPRIVAAPRPPAPAAPPRSSIPAFRTAAFVAAGLGAAAGIGFTIAGSVVDDRIEDLSAALGERVAPGANNACSGALFPKDCAGLQAMINARSGLDTAAQVSFAAGAAFSVLAVSTYLFRRGERGSAPLQVVPVATGQHAGLTVHARW